MGNAFGSTVIMEAASQALAQMVALVKLPQQQTAAIRGDAATLKIGDNFLGEEASKIKLFTADCFQRASSLKH